MRKKRSRKKKLGVISNLVLLANLIAIFALFGSYGASKIDPQTFWPLALLGLGYLPILVVNLCFMAYWLLRKPRYIVLSLAAILLGIPSLKKHFGLGIQSSDIPQKKETDLRVMSYNVHLFESIERGNKEGIHQGVLDIVNQVDPDILCMQEFYSHFKGDNAFINTMRKTGNFEDFYFAPAFQNKEQGYGQAIYSKFPIVASGSVSQHDFGINRIVYADLKREQDTIRVYNVHLRSFTLESEDKEFIQNLSSHISQKEYETRRLGRKLMQAFKHRSQQAQSFKEHIESSPYPVLVLGDFNDTPMSYSVNAVSKNLLNAFQEKGKGWGVTHFDMVPILQIDYILADPVFSVDNFQIIHKKLSDHYPIWADLSGH